MAYILVAEDDPVLRHALAEGLRLEGHDVMEAASADEAAAILASAAVVDLVITDVQMPDSMDGLELARRIRADRPALPVIVVSRQHMGARPLGIFPQAIRLRENISAHCDAGA